MQSQIKKESLRDLLLNMKQTEPVRQAKSMDHYLQNLI